MFELLHEWLKNKLGVNTCLNLNYTNVGKRFKDGVLFFSLLQKYQIIPDCHKRNLKKTDIYAVCLSNIKNINLWLKFLDISVEECDIHQIASGQSLAVTTLLYQLYSKLEKLNQCQTLDTYNIQNNKHTSKHTTQTVDSSSTNNPFQNTLLKQKETNYKNRTITTDSEIFNIPELFCNSTGIKYTAIDVLKSKTNINENSSKNRNKLNFIQYNMNCFYDLFIKLNHTLFKNKFKTKPNEEYNSTSFDFQNIKNKNNVTNDEFNNILNNNIVKIINNFNLKMSIYSENVANIQLDNEYQVVQNNDCTTDYRLYASREDLYNDNLTINSIKMEESTKASSFDENESVSCEKQDIIDEYLQNTGLWSSKYLNIDLQECKQDTLAMIVTKVLNIDNSKKKINLTKIKKTNVAGVINEIENIKVVQLVIDNLKNKGVLGFTTEDAISACLNAYKEEIKISVNKGKTYEVLEEYEEQNEQQIISKTHNNQKLESNSNVISGSYQCA